MWDSRNPALSVFIVGNVPDATSLRSRLIFQGHLVSSTFDGNTNVCVVAHHNERAIQHLIQQYPEVKVLLRAEAERFFFPTAHKKMEIDDGPIMRVDDELGFYPPIIVVI
jgi:glutamine phosphoribosylpyrophosphate amidotransferase